MYRFFAASGELLYVGITLDPPARFKKHRSEKTWWADVATITVTPYPDRPSAEQAERTAIAAERPLWNVTHNQAPRIPADRPTASRRSSLRLVRGTLELTLEADESIDGLAQTAARLLRELDGG